MKYRVTHRRITIGLLVLHTAAGASACGQIQHPTGSPISFEVATIKPAGSKGFIADGPGNEFRSFNFTARNLVGSAYGLPPFTSYGQVLGGPAWVDDKHYDVVAKVPNALFVEAQAMSPEQRRSQLLRMSQTLLAERFKLKVHFETREMPIYELVVAKNGPKLALAKEPPVPHDSALPQPMIGGSPTPGDLRHGFRIRRTAQINEMEVKGETLDAWTQVPLGIDRSIVNRQDSQENMISP
jgi:uncharacterized protein (TIGR03435 family)